MEGKLIRMIPIAIIIQNSGKVTTRTGPRPTEITTPQVEDRGDEMSDKWDKRFLELAKHISLWSKDPSTKVGCVVVGEDREIRSTGFNGFPRGIEDDDGRLSDRARKYPLICHAEENAIMHAARVGVSLKGNTAYVTWPPCSRCTRSLIQAGIEEVVFPKELDIPDRWQEDFAIAMSMMSEAKVSVRQV